ncbi:MAG: transketolase [Candidatus Izemoplasmatales bacterium]|nr:transketolase [Candidatus Izemoplasmatales bacterium]
MEKSINTIRFLGLDMINKANSGHPGIVLGAAGTAYELFTKHLNANPEQPLWFNRDRFFLSAGHGSALLYAILHLSGYNLSIEELKDFRQLGSKTPGHPEYGHTPGVDSTTGPLGQGMAMAIGNALAESYLSATFNKAGLNVVDHYTYTLCGDGDLQEGITMEAMALAGRYNLNKLIVLFDSNDIQLDGPVHLATNENIKQKVQSMNWNYLLIGEPNDLTDLNEAIKSSKRSDKPTFIEVKSIIGFGSKNQGTSKTHGAPIGKEETDLMRKKLNHNYQEFEIPEDVYEDFKNTFAKRGKDLYHTWEETLKAYKKHYPENYQELVAIINNEIDIDFETVIPQEEKVSEATRVTIGKLINTLSPYSKAMIGGSADLTSSTKVKGINGDFDVNNRTGRNINFGVREHAMAGIINGMVLHNLKAFSGGFFIFSDYMKPAIRIASLMNIPSTFIFTHDSVAVGEDGPTHEPVEQLTMFRAMPNINVFRPANANEVKHAFRFALEAKQTPNIIALTRQNINVNYQISYKDFLKGAYSIYEDENFESTFLATGSEVELAYNAAIELKEKHGISVRVVSMPSRELFLKQPQKYQQQILPKAKPVIAVEMGSTMGWYQFASTVYGIDDFGRSGKGEEVQQYFGFSKEKLVSFYLENKDNL